MEANEDLLRSLVRNHIEISNVCNGKGVCGKCKVKIHSGAPVISDTELKTLGSSELTQGYRLACRVLPVDGMVIEVETNGYFDRKEEVLLNFEQSHGECGVEKVELTVPKPSLKDQRGDWERYCATLKAKNPQSIPTAEWNLLNSISQVLRQEDYSVTATLWKKRVLTIEPGNSAGRLFGLAVDIGTTSVALALVDLNTSRVLRILSAENSQTRYGADVITRIAFAAESTYNKQKLTTAVRETINQLVTAACAETGVKPQEIYTLSVVANTTMHHLFLGFEVTQLALSPFVPVCTSPLELTARELDLGINPQAKVLLFPNIGGFVGGDTVGAILGTPQVLAEGNHLLIDIGTNCELFLKTRYRMLACSTAAGPAFEGAGIARGMRARPGAIEGVKIDAEGVRVKVIGNGTAIGICGSGLVEAIQHMRRSGVINKQGKLLDTNESQKLPRTLADRIRQGEHGREFVLCYNSDGSDVTLSQKDISQLQLAKGAVCAGIRTLTELAGITPDQLNSVALSGTFASYLKPESLLEIGLIPAIEKSKIKSVGNAAHGGAIKALIDNEAFKTAKEIGERTGHIELGGNLKFRDYFTQAMYIEASE